MFRRQKLNSKPFSKRRSLFRGRGSGGDIKLPPATLKRTPVIRPDPAALRPPPASPRPVPARRGGPPLPPRRRPPRRRRVALTLINALLACGIAFFWPAAMGIVEHSRNQIWGIDDQVIRDTLGDYVRRDVLPTEVPLAPLSGKPGRVLYHIDPVLQAAVEAELEKHRPDYGMVVAMDAASGRLLAMADIRRDGGSGENMNLRATYPAASVFKTVTAAAAIDLGRVDAGTVLPYNGKTTTLYKKNVLSHRNNKWTRHDSLEESFSKSVNTVFARLGIYTVGGEALLDYSERFGFNHELDADVPVQASHTDMNPADEWSIAETASGYTRGTSISPIHGALLAATIANDGVMPSPRLVDLVTDPWGIILFESESPPGRRIISAEAAAEMRKLMRETVDRGSASRPFRGFSRKYENLDVGGKTGSLTGFEPHGKYDWFVGYASDGERTIAYAVLCINKEYWYVKSSYLARRLIEDYFSG